MNQVTVHVDADNDGTQYDALLRGSYPQTMKKELNETKIITKANGTVAKMPIVGIAFNATMIQGEGEQTTQQVIPVMTAMTAKQFLMAAAAMTAAHPVLNEVVRAVFGLDPAPPIPEGERIEGVAMGRSYVAIAAEGYLIKVEGVPDVAIASDKATVQMTAEALVKAIR